MPNENDERLQEINQEIYKRNLELAVVNKTLSLLRKLYQITLQTLDPASLSEQVSQPVRADLNLEAVGVLMFDKESDSLIPFRFAKSERLLAVLKNLGFMFRDVPIPKVSEKPLLKQVVIEGKWGYTHNLADVWGGVIDTANLKILAKESNLKTILLYPLVTQGKAIGCLLLALNRDYEILSDFEKESIKSCVDVIAVGLDKALLYDQLQKANAQLKELDQARSELITIASHQLRTPPTTIKWYLSSLLDGDYGQVPDNLKQALENMQATNNALVADIDDLLNTSRIERGKMEYVFAETDMAKVTEQLFLQFQPLAKLKNLDLQYIPSSEKIPVLIADTDKIRQVVNNLIDNAIKYTEKGFVKIFLTQKNGNICVAVSDSGKGIKPEEKDKIFDKFTRGADSLYHSSGLGLGMYVAQMIAQTHKGQISAESEGMSKGSTFTLSLPIENGLAVAKTT